MCVCIYVWYVQLCVDLWRPGVKYIAGFPGVDATDLIQPM